MRHSNILFAAALTMGLTGGLTGCMSLSPEETAQAAEQVTAVVAGRVYPSITTGIVANCVRDNASAEELTALASHRDNIGGAAQALVLQIIDRPETDACLRGNGIRLG